MRNATDCGNRSEVERVARMLGKGAHAAFAEHDIVVTFGHDVFGGQQPFIQGRRQATFEQNRQMRFSGATKQGKILHVACADLNHVAVLLNKFKAVFIECFSHNLQTVSLANFSENFETFFSQPLESIRRSARLECAATKETRATAANGLS